MDHLTLKSYTTLLPDSSSSTGKVEEQHVELTCDKINGATCFVLVDPKTAKFTPTSEQTNREIIAHFQKALTEEYGTHVANLALRGQTLKGPLTNHVIKKVIITANKLEAADESDAAAYAKQTRINAAFAKAAAATAREQADEAASIVVEAKNSSVSGEPLKALQKEAKAADISAKETKTQAATVTVLAETFDKQYTDKKNRTTTTPEDWKALQKAFPTFLKSTFDALDKTTSNLSKLTATWNQLIDHLWGKACDAQANPEEAVAAWGKVVTTLEAMQRILGEDAPPDVQAKLTIARSNQSNVQTKHLFSTAANAERINQGLTDYANGRVQSGELVD